MEKLESRIADLAVVAIAEHIYLSYQAVTVAVAAFLFPGIPTRQIDETQYQRILETADAVCHNLGYTDVARLTPPQVAFTRDSARKPSF